MSDYVRTVWMMVKQVHVVMKTVVIQTKMTMSYRMNIYCTYECSAYKHSLSLDSLYIPYTQLTFLESPLIGCLLSSHDFINPIVKGQT